MLPAPTPGLPVVAGTSLPTETVARLDEEVLGKLTRLEAALGARGAVLVAYSGGVDSTLIAAVAMRAVGPWDPQRRRGVVAVLADSATLARRERILARATADQIGVPLEEVQYSELDNTDWSVNDERRCYHCKKDLAAELQVCAKAWGFRPDQIAFGVTVSDLGDHRPGIAATEEAGAWRPLVDAGLIKPEVRALAKHLDLPVWDKPATPCLASRVQYGEHINEGTLARIEAAEEVLRDLGHRVFRVRHHDRVARIEVPPLELERVIADRDHIVAALRGLGYTYVTLDLMGFRSGAMNEAIEGKDRQ